MLALSEIIYNCLFLVSLNILPIYKPKTPKKQRFKPPTNQIENTVIVKPSISSNPN
jgi:hypothetical protein